MEKTLEGVRVLDMSRILAGPYCTQMLGDLGADIIKIERPGVGDDTRKFGPPFLRDEDGRETTESAYYMSCNRNKRSVALDFTTPEGQAILDRLMAQSDILVENYKPGGLAKYGLSYDQIKDRHPHLVYASISGYGQTGPLASESGYDFVAQGMSGMMACTGFPEGDPTKVGVAISDILTGLHAVVGILAALHHRQASGQGQHVDVALLDCSVASMAYIAQFYLTAGKVSGRIGNQNPTIVPYQCFKTKDGYVVIAVGNDVQFSRFCAFAGLTDLPTDPRFSTNKQRVINRLLLIPMLEKRVAQDTASFWIEGLRGIEVPVGPVNTMDQVFGTEQVQARGMQIRMDHPLSDGPINLVGSPLKLSDSPVEYRLPPPRCGEHTVDVLTGILGLSSGEIEDLCARRVLERLPDNPKVMDTERKAVG